MRVGVCGSARVHPRACGGNACEFSGVVRDAGPSPRVRGKPDDVAVGGHGGGSIPARAGETIRNPGKSAAAWVHPRACGGNRHGRR